MTFLKYPLPCLSRFELWPGPVEGGPTVSGSGAENDPFPFWQHRFIVPPMEVFIEGQSPFMVVHERLDGFHPDISQPMLVIKDYISDFLQGQHFGDGEFKHLRPIGYIIFILNPFECWYMTNVRL